MKADLWLVDTSVWIEVMPSRGAIPELRERLDMLIAEDQVATTGMILLELLGGARSDDEYQRLLDLMSALHVLNADEQIWQKASRLAFELRRKGLTIPFTHILIAAVALQGDTTLLHRDRHFDILASQVSLKVESYV